MKVVIMAGGMGTRISSVAHDIPKPMISACGKPILQHQLECLRQQGLTDITIVTGHLGSVISSFFGDGSSFGVSITYYHELEPLGTAGALLKIIDQLTEDFLLINGDIIFDVDFFRFIQFHQEKKSMATLLTHPNGHPYDSALVFTASDGQITNWLHKEEPRENYKNRVNAGLHILSWKMIAACELTGKVDLDRDILKPLIASERLYAYDSSEYVHDMGTPERYKKVCQDIEAGIVKNRSLQYKQKAVFLDRDGTLNEYKGFIRSPDEISLLPKVSEALRYINESAYLSVVVTNQPVVARGECTIEEVCTINNRLETLLGNDKAYIDGLLFCPHHPDKGFEGERLEYKIKCDCRKPRPGLLLKAAEKFNIDLLQSFMVGDTMADIQAGIAAGCTSVYIGKPISGLPEGVIYCEDVYDFVVNILLSEEEQTWLLRKHHLECHS